MLDRRCFLGGLVAAPAVIRTPGLLMPIHPWIEPWVERNWAVPSDFKWIANFSGGPDWVEIAAESWEALVKEAVRLGYAASRA